MPKSIIPENLSNVSDETVELIRFLMGSALGLIRAGADKTKQEEVLMETQERVKEEIDRRAFADSGPRG